MLLDEKKKTLQYITLLPLVTVVSISVLLIGMIIVLSEKNLQDEIHHLKSVYIENEKQKIKTRVLSAVDLIDFKRKLKNGQTLQKKKEDVLRRLSNLNFTTKGYIYVVNKEGKLLAHRNKKIIGSDAFAIKDPNGIQYMKKGYELAKKNKETYLRYISVTNEEMSWNNQKKLAYAKYYPQFEWVVSSGAYIEDLDNEIAQRVQEAHKKKQKQYGYIVSLALIISVIVIFVFGKLSKKIKEIIAQKEKDLKDLNKTLEDKVNHKTNELKQNLQFVHRLLKVIPLPIYIKNKDFEFVQCNDAFYDFVGKSQKDVLGKTVFDLFSTQDARRYNIKDHELKTKNYQFYQSEIIDKYNESKAVELYKSSLLEDGEFNGLVGVIVDVTKRERLQHELKQQVIDKTLQNFKQSKQFEQEQLKNIKFSSIGQLAAGITHEINTPLTYIKGNFEMMQYDFDAIEDSEIQTRLQEDSKKIADGLNRIESIVESMREMSQKSTEEFELSNLYSTLVVALTMAHNRAKQIAKIYLNGEEFDLNIDKNRHTFYSNIQKQRIEQVWVVIINNALDELSSIDKEFEDKFIAVDILSHEGKIIIRFRDNAGGIDKSILENIFEPFVSSKDYGGMGVGLNISEKIIEEQGGSIQAYNQNEGAVFEIIVDEVVV